MEWKEAFDAAVEKTVGAYEKMEEAFLSGSKEGFEHWHAEYCRYIYVFTEATGIPESQFIEIVNDAALKKKEQNKQISIGGHGGRRKGGTMKDTYFNNLKVRLFADCSNVNSYEEQKDLERNRVNYGCAISWAQVMRDFGHDVDLPVYDSDGFLRIAKIVIDGEVYVDFEATKKEIENQSKSE